MQKIPCHCQTDATGTRFQRPVLSNFSPWSINFHEAVFVLSPPHTSLCHHFVRWCSWFNKVVFLLCWRPLLSTLMWHNGSSDQYSQATGRVNSNWWGLIGMIKVSVSLCDQIHQSNWKVVTFIVLNREQRCQNHGYIGKPAKSSAI